LCCSVYCLCVNVYCHRVTTQLQLINILLYYYYYYYYYNPSKQEATDPTRKARGQGITKELYKQNLHFFRQMSNFDSGVYTHLNYNLLACDATYFGRKHSKIFGLVSHNTTVLIAKTQESKILVLYVNGTFTATGTNV
jgi:hypothetical protein